MRSAHQGSRSSTRLSGRAICGRISQGVQLSVAELGLPRISPPWAETAEDQRGDPVRPDARWARGLYAQQKAPMWAKPHSPRCDMTLARRIDQRLRR